MTFKILFGVACAGLCLTSGCLDRKKLTLDAAQNPTDAWVDAVLQDGYVVDTAGSRLDSAGGVDLPGLDLGVDAPITPVDGPGSGEVAVTATGGTSAAGGGPGTGGVSGTGGLSTTGGVPGTGGVPTTGGIVGTGGMGVGGSGSGGQVTCSGSTKLCNGACIPSTSCCGGCSGNTPVCSNGTCVGRPLGDPCASGAECTSAVCADGVCCNAACDGQCESCSTSASKGTCVPTTTPRTPCAGTGICAGICDGSTTNRKTCAYPGGTTSCGASASCSAGKLTTAAVCNGAGACNASTVTTCPYGCKTDGTIGCATSCPSGQGLCGGSCVDILSSPTHCGGSCQVCSGTTTPYCYAGSCVQCLTGQDCITYAEGATCAANHACQCRTPNPGNLVQNGGFDTSLGLAGWTINTGFTTLSTDDAEGCPTSGSIQLSTSAQGDYGGMYECVSVAANTTYNFGYRYKQQVSEVFLCNLFFHAGANCPQWFSVTSLRSGASTGTAWQSASTSTTSPASAGSASISCTINTPAPAGWIDQIYLNPTASGY